MQQSHKDWNEEGFRNGIVLNFLNETENLSKGLGTLYTTNSVTFTSEALSVYLFQRLDKGRPSFDILCGKRMPFICGKNYVWTDGRKLMVDGLKKNQLILFPSTLFGLLLREVPF